MAADGAGAVDLHQDFETWARISARMQRLSPIGCAKVVREAAISPSTWASADAHWLSVLSLDIEKRRMKRPQRYRAVCAEELKARAAAGAVIPSPLDALRSGAGPRSKGTPQFAQRFAPAGVSPKAPEPRQDGTRVDIPIIAGKTEEMSAPAASKQELTVEEALSWPPERYAWVCAQLERYPDRVHQVWATVGVFSPAARTVVRLSWERKLEQDARAREHHRELLNGYLQGPPPSGR